MKFLPILSLLLKDNSYPLSYKNAKEELLKNETCFATVRKSDNVDSDRLTKKGFLKQIEDFNIE